jgi:Pectate lyase superfamily protein
MPEIPAYPLLSSPASGDELVIVDISDTSASSQGTTKKVTVSSLAAAGTDWVNVVTAGGDPTGSAAVDSIVNGIISGFGSQGGVVYFPAGTYKVSSGITALLSGTQTVTLLGDGASATVLKYYGSADCIRMYNSSAFGSGGAQSWFSGIRDLTVDGASGTGSPVGIHLGDITFLQVQGVVVQNFTGTSSIGVHFDNTVNWTEEGDYRAAVSNCTRGVVLEVTTGYNSFGYSNFDLTFFQAAAQSCFCVTGGALLYHSALRIRGDVTGSASALTGNPAVIVASGSGPGGSHASGDSPGISGVHMDVLIESNNLSGSAPHLMQTLYLDSSTFGYIVGCYGMMDFAQGTGSFTAASSSILPGNTGNLISFSGVVAGDSTVNPAGLLTWQTWGGGTILNALPAAAFDGFIPTLQADVFTTTLDGSESQVYLNYSGVGNGSTLAAPQRKLLFVRQPASGGPYGLTWTMAGTPTNAAPVIVWAGGAPPVLQTAPSGTDVIELVTYDGATWYGRQLASYGTATGQNVSLAPERQRVTLTTAFSSGTGTSAQNVTGMSAYLPAGTYRLRGWFPCQFHGTDAGTQTFGWTFGGTVSSAVIKWASVSSGTAATYATAAGTSNTALTTTSAAVTMSSTGLWMEFDALVTVSAAGTLQLQVASGTSGDEITVPAGAYLDIEPLA